MTLAVAAELALRSSILLAFAWLSAAAIEARRGSAAIRHATWMLGFATLASLPLLMWLLPPLPVPVLPAEALAAAVPTAATATAPQLAAPERQLDPFALLYVSVSLVLMVRLAIGRLLLERMWAKAASAGACERDVFALASLLGIRRTVQVRVTRVAIVPMTWGSIHPRIVLPRQALAWTAERRRSVLLHELGHVSRHDSSGALIVQAVCALYWANPLTWLAARQMRLAQEQACDDLVLANGAAAIGYARDLLDSASSLHPRLLSASVAMTGATSLEKRLRSILGEASRQRPGSLWLSASAILAALGGTLAAVVLPVAAAAPARALPEIPSAFEQPAPVVRDSFPLETHPATIDNGRKRHATHSRRLVSREPSRAFATVERTSFDEYRDAVARYRRESAEYRVELANYRTKLGIYRSDMEQYSRDLAEHRRLVERIRALPEGDPRKLVPPAPVAPVAPVAPTAPVVPPVPPDLHQS